MMTNLAASFFLLQEIFLAIFVAVIMAWLSIKLAVTLKLIDYPGSAPHKQHTRPTPLAGGIAMLAALLITEGVFGTFADPNVKATFLGAAVVFLFGLWDDYKNIPPLIKLAGQAGAAILLINLGVSIQIFESPQFFIRTGPEAARYLDWILTLPWTQTTPDNLDLEQARRILDEDHFDLDKVKDRIVEYLAVSKLKGDVSGPILCFVGPPGVGKTSLGESVARALGRKFTRVSLGTHVAQKQLPTSKETASVTLDKQFVSFFGLSTGHWSSCCVFNARKSFNQLPWVVVSL